MLDAANVAAQHAAFPSTSVFSERIQAAEKCFDWCVGKEGLVLSDEKNRNIYVFPEYKPQTN